MWQVGGPMWRGGVGGGLVVHALLKCCFVSEWSGLEGGSA